MANFVIVNGIRTTGDRNIDLLGDELTDRGHTVVDLGIPVIGAVGASRRAVQRRNGRLLNDAAREHFAEGSEVNVIGHSNGAATIYRSMWPTARFRWSAIILFNAAMREDWAWPSEGFDTLHNVHNPHDKALKWGSRARWVMPAHIFGAMGKTGYSGTPPDDRIKNHNNPFRESKSWHNPWYCRYEVVSWANRVEDWVAPAVRSGRD